VGVPGTAQFLGTPYYPAGKATYFKFCKRIHRIGRNKGPLKISGKVAVGVVRDSRNFHGIYNNRAHRAVIFALAKLSC